jgi:hypothetical protein
LISGGRNLLFWLSKQNIIENSLFHLRSEYRAYFEEARIADRNVV